LSGPSVMSETYYPYLSLFIDGLSHRIEAGSRDDFRQSCEMRLFSSGIPSGATPLTSGIASLLSKEQERFRKADYRQRRCFGELIENWDGLEW
ncbi:MAG: hypothetical protein L0Y56_21660, partial [Nitrospira sp.]|nr:hypothetical protein [Nitrospira sp.]